jgi:hypothetical protein
MTVTGESSHKKNAPVWGKIGGIYGEKNVTFG